MGKETKISVWDDHRVLAAIFESLSAHVVTLDRYGRVEAASRSWLDFARERGGEIARTGHGVDYLSVCRRAAEEGYPLAQAALEGIEGVLSGRLPRTSLEYPCHEPSGRERWFLMNVDPMPEDHGGVVISHIDITDRVAAEEALRRSEERYRAVVEDQTELVCRFLPDTTLTFVNSAYARYFGRSPDELIGQSFLILVPEAQHEPTRQHIRSLVENPRVGSYEHEVCAHRGELRWQQWVDRPIRDSSGRVIEFQSVGRDVTERKLVEKALIESEERRVRTEQFSLVMVTHVDLEGRWLKVPPTLCRLLGYTEEELLGHRFHEVTHPDDVEADWNQCLKLVRGEIKSFDLEKRYRRKDGSIVWVYLNCSVVPDAEGNPVHLLTYIRDITKRKQAEEALEEALAEVQRLKERLEAENVYLRSEVSGVHRYGRLVGRSPKIQKVLEQVEQVAGTNMTVLILGETGTGKELVARAVHEKSGRKDRPLVKVNCSALPGELIESELFGHEKGAFTGATARQVGRFELADGATIFLDEVAELPLRLQAKLLRVLQEAEFERLGSGKTIKVDVRVIAATNRNLVEAIQKERFRLDLYYRLNVYPIQLPPLKERVDDIEALAALFVAEVARRLGRTFDAIPRSVVEALKQYEWPGNVRELQNVIERAAVTSTTTVLQLPEGWAMPLRPGVSSGIQTVAGAAPIDPSEAGMRESTLQQFHRKHILEVLNQTGWRIEGPRGAAVVLGLNPSTLRSRMQKLGIQKPKPMTADTTS
jgi:formate hydrogenlyase transcriptional activator